MIRQRKKRTIAAYVLIFSILLSWMPTPIIGLNNNTQAAQKTGETSQKSGDFRYVMRADGTVKISGYTGNKKYVAIPGTINNKTVTEIGENAFRNQKFSRVKIPDSVTEIADGAFENCNYLISVTFPEQLKKIGNYAFSVCNRLKKIEIPENLTEIGDGAFFYCSAMEKVIFKGVPATLGNYLFANCTSLSSVDSSEEFKEISEGMFYSCEQLTSIETEGMIEKIGDRAFTNCTNLAFNNLDALKEIGDLALSSIDHVSEMTLSENCKVEESVLESTSVDTLTIESAKVEQDAFKNAQIDKMVIGADVDASAQKGIRRAKVKDFDVDENNPNYAEYKDSLYDKKKTELLKHHTTNGTTWDQEENEIDLADGVSKIGEYACYEIESSKLDIPDSVTEIGQKAFSGNYELSSVQLGKKTEVIGDGAFAYCFNLSDFKGGEHVTSIGKEAFYDCTRLKEFSIPDSLKTIGEGAFLESELQSFDVSEAQPYFKEVKGALLTKDGQELVCMAPGGEMEIPDGVTKLRSRSVPGVSKVVIPDGVKELEDCAILGKNNQEITLPNSVSKIGEKAIGYFFDGDSGVKQASQNIIYSKGMTQTAKKYAEENDIAIAEEKTDVNKSDIKLAGNETFQVCVPGIPSERTCYTSTDNAIASVSGTGEITAHKKGTTFVTVSIGDLSWHTKVTVTSDGTPYLSSYSLSDYANPADNAKEWYEAYQEENNNHEFTCEEEPNTYIYSGNSYVPMKALLEYGQEYVSSAEEEYGKNYKRYAQINENLAYELSQFKLHANTIFYSGVRTVKNLTGASDSVADMKASIGKKGVYKCITSTTYNRSVASGFMYGGRGGTMLELYVPKGYNKGAYISEYSQFESESEYLMASDFHYEIIDAGIRTYEEDGEETPVAQRYMKLLILPEKSEPEVTSTPTPAKPSAAPTKAPLPTATTDNTKKTTKTIQKKVKGVTYQVSGKKAVILKADKTLKNASIPSKIKIKGKTYPVTEIRPGAFKNCGKLKKITLGNSIRVIGKNAFKNIQKKAVFKVKKKYFKKYKKLLSKRTGYRKTMKIKV